MIFVDTNYFLRYFIDDGSFQHQKATALFIAAARGEKKLITSPLVIFEIFLVLGSAYRLNKSQKINILENLFNMTFINLKERDLFKKTVQIYKKTALEFEDCYHLIYLYANKINKIATFDKKLLKEAKKINKSIKTI